jgi:hypothetical protein
MAIKDRQTAQELAHNHPVIASSHSIIIESRHTSFCGIFALSDMKEIFTILGPARGVYDDLSLSTI